MLPPHQDAELVAGLPRSTADCWSVAEAWMALPPPLRLLFLGTLGCGTDEGPVCSGLCTLGLGWCLPLQGREPGLVSTHGCSKAWSVSQRPLVLPATAWPRWVRAAPSRFLCPFLKPFPPGPCSQREGAQHCHQRKGRDCWASVGSASDARSPHCSWKAVTPRSAPGCAGFPHWWRRGTCCQPAA